MFAIYIYIFELIHYLFENNDGTAKNTMNIYENRHMCGVSVAIFHVHNQFQAIQSDQSICMCSVCLKRMRDFLFVSKKNVAHSEFEFYRFKYLAME